MFNGFYRGFYIRGFYIIGLSQCIHGALFQTCPQGSSKLMQGIQHDRFLSLNGTVERRTYQKPQVEANANITVLGNGKGKGNQKGGGRKAKAPKLILSSKSPCNSMRVET